MRPKAEHLPPAISASQILCYLECPRKYRFRYVERLPPESRRIELSFGSAVHGTIGWWVEERLAGRDPPQEVLDRTFRVDWFAEQQVGVPIVAPKAPRELEALGKGLVRLFVERFRSEVFTGSEVRVEVEVYDRRAHRSLPVPLLGYLDFTTEAVVGEVKTGSRKASWRNWELQLAAYRYATRRLDGERPRPLRVVQLLKMKEPALEVEDAPIGVSDERWFVEVACAVYDSAARGAFHPSPSHRCFGCEYRSACRG